VKTWQRSLKALAVAAALGAAACGSNAATSMNVIAPAGSRCQATVSNPSPSFPAAGGTGTVTVTVPRDCAWTAASQSPFVTITAGQEGQGDGAVTYRVAENEDPIARQGALVVSERPVGITQAAAPCRFEVWPASEAPIAPQGGVLSVELRTHEACAWSASSEVPWASILPASGRGNAGLQVTVEANTGAVRAGSLVVAGHRIGLSQSAGAGPTPTPSPTPTPAPAPAPNPAPTPEPSPSPGPTPVRTIDLEGRLSGLSGACPAVTFRLRGYDVYTTSSTRYDDGECPDLRNGDEVEVRGTLMSDGRVRADRVEIDD
jgi:hypothetical protein